ncbi:MAG: (deoxy)nucleoside triphosphate pyrophosphohydrolase [Microbacterium sp.]|uniref:(deoxy)nucleoside triphosphate pyrophosphohydrolase n=1 Tax=Microbacterium sp. TaxID=51671 RepID=UPI003BAEF347
MGKTVNVVGAIIFRDGKALAARRGPTMSLPGLWEFPGGKIEPGESPQEALSREVAEELHCTIEVGEHVTATSHLYDFGTVVLTTFYARLSSGDPMATEHSELRWCTGPELNALEWAPADLPAVTEAVARLRVT